MQKACNDSGMRPMLSFAAPLGFRVLLGTLQLTMGSKDPA